VGNNNAELMERLRNDWPTWSEHCAKIVNTKGELVPLYPKPAQMRIWEAMQAQTAAGKPVRIIVPKARKEGVSTMAQSLVIQRTTMRPNHTAYSVAQDNTTAGELLQMATMMYGNLPDSRELPIKPPIANKRRRKELVFGNPARTAQATGDLGINSRLIVDTAAEFEAGRGFTFHTVHASEPAFWPDLKRKLTSLLNAVPDEPGTMVILESTSNGHNHWRTLCMDALDGKNDFQLVFLGWFEEPQYVRPFATEQEQADFENSIGTGDFGLAEPELLDAGVSLEQLNWRRWAIMNRCQGDIRLFQQEYPSNLAESFLSTSRQVFVASQIGKTRKRAEEQPGPVPMTLHAGGHRDRRVVNGSVRIPTEPQLRPVIQGDLFRWDVWEQPQDGAGYVIGVDPAGDEVQDEDDRAMHGVVIINHRTGEQAAELEVQGDVGLLADQIYMAALVYNRAWVAIERTGGWGLSMIRKLRDNYGYPFLYRQKKLESGEETSDERYGFDSNRTTKAFLVADVTEYLREGTTGLRSIKICRQMDTYIRTPKKPHGEPANGERADLLMGWAIGKRVAAEKHPTVRSGSGVVSTTTHVTMNRVTGW
jgi:hypothetical protein